MSEPKKRICFYHRDLDGYCAGAIVAKHFNWEIELVSINYNDEFPWDRVDADTEVWMVDFGLQPFRDMVTLNELVRKFIWIDHHESALKEYEECYAAGGSGEIRGLRQIGLSGCELTWKYLHLDVLADPRNPMSGVPSAVYLIGVVDTWNWEGVENAYDFVMGMRQFEKMSPTDALEIPKCREMWDTLLSTDASSSRQLIRNIIDTGRTLLEYQTKENRQQARGSRFLTKLDGVPVIAANRGYTNSLFFDSVLEDFPEALAVLTFHFRKGVWNISMYQIEGRKTPNLGEIAKAHGGGGHAGAAGFQVYGFELPFDISFRTDPR